MSIGGKQTYQCVNMHDFLGELSKRVKRNTTSFDNFERMFLPPREVPPSAEGSPLRTNVLYKHIQGLLAPEHVVVAETGDSWFNCLKLKLPDGCKYEFQVRQPASWRLSQTADTGSVSYSWRPQSVPATRNVRRKSPFCLHDNG